MSEALVWQLIRNNNAFLVKRGQTRRDGSVQFSSEPGNLLNVNSFKYSGIANSATIAVDSKDKKISLVVKDGKEVNKPKKASVVSVFKVDPKSSIAAIKSVPVRGDILSTAITRYNKLNRAIKIKKGILKAPKAGKARGTR